jgi:hypothetical protein
MWLNLAAVSVQDALGDRDRVARALTLVQLAEAQRLAQECLASKYKLGGEPN